MSTLENTISMPEVLPEADLIKIQDFAQKLFRQRGTECPFPLLSGEDIIRNAKISEQQIVDGEDKNAGDFLAELRQEYGI